MTENNTILAVTYTPSRISRELGATVNPEIFNELLNYYNELLGSNTEEFEIRAKSYCHFKWPDWNGRVTYQRVHRFVVMSSNGQDIMLRYFENDNVSFNRYVCSLFYYKGYLVEVLENYKEPRTQITLDKSLFMCYPTTKVEEGISRIKKEFISFARNKRLTRMSKKSLVRICSFLHISKEDMEQIYNLNKKR